jgi:hypothetical protein
VEIPYKIELFVLNLATVKTIARIKMVEFSKKDKFAYILQLNKKTKDCKQAIIIKTQKDNLKP